MKLRSLLPLLVFLATSAAIRRPRRRSISSYTSTPTPTQRHHILMEELSNRLIKDMGWTSVPAAAQKNFTAQEVIVKSRVYQRSKRQLAMMEELRDIFETEENARSEISDPSGTCTYTPKRAELRSRLRRRRRSTDASAEQISSARELRLMFPLEEERNASLSDLVLVRKAILTVRVRLNDVAGARAGCDGDEAFILSAKQLLRNGGHEDLGIKVNFVRVTLDDFNEAGEAEVELDASMAVQYWLLQPEENAGITVECSSGPCELISFAQETRAKLSVETSRKRAHPRAHLRLKRSVFHRALTGRSVPRSRRGNECSAVEEPYAPSPADSAAADEHGHGHHHRRRRRSGNGHHKRQRPKCCRGSMPVHLSNIPGIGGIILQPTEFDAHYCRGTCPPGHLPSNVHTILQAILHNRMRDEPDRVPRPCCAPARMRPLAILHLSPTATDELEVSMWKDAIVADCRCL